MIDDTGPKIREASKNANFKRQVDQAEELKRKQNQEERARIEKENAEPTKSGYIPPERNNNYRSSALVMSCTEAQIFLTTIASLKDKGYPLSSALAQVNSAPGFSQAEKNELRQIVTSIYLYNLSPDKALLSASLACK